MTIKTLRKLTSEGPVPMQVYNDLVDVVTAIAKLEVGDNMNLLKGPNGFQIGWINPDINQRTFGVEGPLFEGTEGLNAAGLLFSPGGFFINKVVAYVEATSSSGSVIVDVNLHETPDGSGTTIFTIQANRPTIIAGEFASLDNQPNVFKVKTGQYISIDVDNAGIGAKNLTVILYGQQI